MKVTKVARTDESPVVSATNPIWTFYEPDGS